MIFLTKENYYNKESNIEYCSCSQIKDFIACERCAYLKLLGQYKEEESEALAISSLIDAVLSNEEAEFLDINKDNPFIFLKNGKLSAKAQAAYEVIQQAENDQKFIKYLNGEHQVIMTGIIADVPIKIKMDSYFKDKVIVDLKCMKNFDLLWNDELRIKQNFIDYYDYVMQAAIYQEIVFQNTGKRLPFIIAAMTKEKYSERALLNIPPKEMDSKLEEVKEILPRIQAIKRSEEAIGLRACGKCNYCKSVAKVTNIYNYKDYFNKRGGLI